MKNDLGLDHLECRGWQALAHHTMLVMMAMSFLQHLRLRRKKEDQGPGGTTPKSFAARDPAHSGPAPQARAAPALPALP